MWCIVKNVLSIYQVLNMFYNILPNLEINVDILKLITGRNSMLPLLLIVYIFYFVVQESTGYEYSYIVYDDSTGDHKAQRELSDGSVVRGEYSFLQPDGYVREVQYVADDIQG